MRYLPSSCSRSPVYRFVLLFLLAGACTPADEAPAEATPEELASELTAQGPYADNKAVLDIFITKGGIFDASPPEPTSQKDGDMLLEFSGCNAGTITYTIPSINRQGTVPVERIALDNIPLCETLATQAQ